MTHAHLAKPVHAFVVHSTMMHAALLVSCAIDLCCPDAPWLHLQPHALAL